VTPTATKQTTEASRLLINKEATLDTVPFVDRREWQAQRLQLLWDHRRLFFRAAGVGLILSALIAFLIPNQYTSTTQLMPPDNQSSSPMAMMAALAKTSGALGSLTSDLLPMKSNGAMFLGVLRSQTVQDRLVQQFDLKKVYGKKLAIDARKKLDENTFIAEDRKSGIITITVTDHNKERAAALAGAYVEQLNSLVAELSTSAAHRERVFLGDRLTAVKQELDTASDQLAQFSSKNSTLDIRDEGRAMLDAAAGLAGQMIAVQSQLEGLRQIYTDSNPRVRSLNAHVAELRKQLQKIGGAKDKPGSNDSAVDPTSDMPYPSIQKLPLLGVKYADFYRRVKIQETVFELLTQQFELAKVQEVRETPSVKTLDPATVPERKSFPPRSVIILAGAAFAVVIAVIWVLGSTRWQKVDPDDPRKIFLQQIGASLKSQAPWTPQNGHSSGVAASRPPETGD
jgi:uncharacterized protein involved in exopolysaccharide biosynthesis